MRMEHQLKLVDTVTSVNDVGIPVLTETKTTVWADKLSAKRSEHYAANAAGIRVDIVFSVNADDYAGQTEVEWNSFDEFSGQYVKTKYNVVRSYAVGRGRVELTCALR